MSASSVTAGLPAILWRRRWIVLAVFALTMAAAVAVTISLPERYTARAYALVSPTRTPSSDFEATQLTQVLSRTYAELLQSEAVGAKVKARTPDPGGADLRVVAVPQSQLLAVEATHDSPAAAQRLADTALSVYAEQVTSVAAAGGVNGRLSVAQTATPPAGPSRPRPLLYLSVAALLGGVLAVALALARDRLDPRVRVKPGTRELYGIPVLAHVPKGGDERARSEAAHAVLAGLAQLDYGAAPAAVAVLPAAAGRSARGFALSLAGAAAERGFGVLVVDADLRRASELLPSPEHDDHATRAPAGLVEVLTDPDAPLMRHVAAIDVPPVSVLAERSTQLTPVALLTPERLYTLQSRAVRLFNLVIYLAPALVEGPEAANVAALAQSSVLVVDPRADRSDDVEWALTQLVGSRSGALGIVVADEAGAPRTRPGVRQAAPDVPAGEAPWLSRT